MESNNRIEYTNGFEFSQKILAIGKIYKYDENHLYKNLGKNRIIDLYEMIQKTRFDEIERYIHTLAPLEVFIGDKSEIKSYMFSTMDVLGAIEAIKNDNGNLLYDFTETFVDFIDQKLLASKKNMNRLETEGFEQLRGLCKKFAIELAENVQREEMKDAFIAIKEDFILFVDEFRIHHIDYLPNNLKAIIYNNSKIDKKYISHFSYDMSLPIVRADFDFKNDERVILDGYDNIIIKSPLKSDVYKFNKKNRKLTYLEANEESFEDTKIKIYTNIGTPYNMDKILISNWYQGVCLVKTEYAYFTKGRIPSKAELIDYHIAIFEKFKDREIHINIPDLREEKPIKYLDHITTDIPSYMRNSDFFLDYFDALAIASQKVGVNPKIYIPNVRLDDEAGFWRSLIEEAFRYYELLKPEIGIIVETESAFEYYLDYEYLKFGVIDLDDLLKEISNDYDRFYDLSFEEFVDVFLPQLRDLHQHYRRRHFITEHVLMGNCLTNPDILYYLFKLGFYKLNVPHDKIKLILEPMDRFKKSFKRWISLEEKDLQPKKDIK